MRKLVLIIFVAAFPFLTGFDLGGILPGVSGRFGSSGRAESGTEPMDWQATDWGMRWFPNYVQFGPDGDTVLVSLCHVKRVEFCRIGRYHISQDRWDILPAEQYRTYLYPTFSPDGKWIVFSTASCGEQALCDARNFALARMPADGSKMEILADTTAKYPSFSQDGKKLIYWKWKMALVNGKKSPTAMEVYEFDMDSRQETELTNLINLGNERGKVFFLPDGEHFVFAVEFDALIWNATATFGQPTVRAVVASLKDAPITQQNYGKVKILWPNGKIGEVLDVDRQGRILYEGGFDAKSPLSLAVRPSNPNYIDVPKTLAQMQQEDRTTFTDEQIRRGAGAVNILNRHLQSKQYQQGMGSGLFLRKPLPDAQPEAAFDMELGSHWASVSPDSKHVVTIGGLSPTPHSHIALIAQGERMSQVRFINWPRIDLTSSPAANP